MFIRTLAGQEAAGRIKSLVNGTAFGPVSHRGRRHGLLLQ
jgi:hypothetical protein